MALTLAEAAKLQPTPLAQGVVETFRMESVILDRIPLKPIDGNAYKYNEEASLPGVEFRAVNSAYSESTGTFNQKTEGLVILGGDADVDTFIKATQSGNGVDQKAEQTVLKVKAATYKFQDTFINGDTAVDANAFDGLKKRLTGAQVLDAATNGLPILGADSEARHAFFDVLDELLDAVDGGAEVLYMNRFVRAWLRSAARREGFHSADRDEFGRVVDRYNDVPFVDVGNRADGTMILPQTETQGTGGAVHSSIYAVRFGQGEADRAVTGLSSSAYPGGIDVRDLGEQHAKPADRIRIEGFLGLAVFGPGAARLRGVRKS